MLCPRCSYSWVPRVECPKKCPDCFAPLDKPEVSADVSVARLHAIAQFCIDNHRSDFALNINQLAEQLPKKYATSEKEPAK